MLFRSISNETVYQNSLLVAAVENAREKASVIARAGGRNLGIMLSATANDGGYNEVMFDSMPLAKSAGTNSAVTTDLSPKNIKLNASVEVVFSLK